MADPLRIVLDTNVYISAALHGGLAETALSEDDNRILECAVAGEAVLIVTYDQDLLRLRRYNDIGIVSPQELLYYGLAE